VRAQEIVETESIYVEHLRTMVVKYERPLREALRGPSPILTEVQIDLLFSEVGNILVCHESWLSSNSAALILLS